MNALPKEAFALNALLCMLKENGVYLHAHTLSFTTAMCML